MTLDLTTCGGHRLTISQCSDGLTTLVASAPHGRASDGRLFTDADVVGHLQEKT